MRTQTLAAAVFLAFASVASAQSPSLEVATVTGKRVFKPGSRGAVGSYKWSYSAKFLCGTVAGTPTAGTFPTVLPGVYATAINIRNPNFRDVTLSKTALETLPEQDAPGQQPPGGTSATKFPLLPARGGLEVDCTDIVSLLFPAGGVAPPSLATTFIKGFVSIESVLDLDVVGVYTAR